MNTQPKVSVIMPSLNVREYIGEALESVIGQTLSDIEIICVDAGSTDGTFEIIREYANKDNRIHVISSERKSYGLQMNLGVDAASGEYIGIVETDDRVSLNMYEELYNVASANGLDLVKSDFYRFKRDSGGKERLQYNAIDSALGRYDKIFDPSQDPSFLRSAVNTWTGIYRREFLLKNNIKHNETPGASYQDNGFFFQTFAFAKRAMFVNKAYYYNRRDNPNSSVMSKAKVYCMNEENDFIMDVLKRDYAIWERFKYMYWWRKYHNYMFTLKRIDKQYRPEFLKRMSLEFRRASQLDELKKDVFSESEWGNLQSIIKDSARYCRKFGNLPPWVRKAWQALPQSLRSIIKKILWRNQHA